MQRYNRKSTPQVVHGKVRKKNNWDLSEDYYDAPRPKEVVIDRQRPGPGYRHILTRQDIHTFLGLLPDWNKLAVGLNAIVLGPGDPECYGYHVRGVVHIYAWESKLWQVFPAEMRDYDKTFFARLGCVKI